MALVKSDDGLIRGKYLYYHEVGKIGKTKHFQIRTRDSSVLIGNVKWYAPWRKYCFFATNCILEETCMLEIVAFCQMKTTEHKANWKPRKNKFNKTYDMTNRNKLGSNSKVEYLPVKQIGAGSSPASSAILEEICT